LAAAVRSAEVQPVATKREAKSEPSLPLTFAHIEGMLEEWLKEPLRDMISKKAQRDNTTVDQVNELLVQFMSNEMEKNPGGSVDDIVKHLLDQEMDEHRKWLESQEESKPAVARTTRNQQQRRAKRLTEIEEDRKASGFKPLASLKETMMKAPNRSEQARAKKLKELRGQNAAKAKQEDDEFIESMEQLEMELNDDLSAGNQLLEETSRSGHEPDESLTDFLLEN
jgi:hypothetical protein